MPRAALTPPASLLLEQTERGLRVDAPAPGFTPLTTAILLQHVLGTVIVVGALGGLWSLCAGRFGLGDPASLLVLTGLLVATPRLVRDGLLHWREVRSGTRLEVDGGEVVLQRDGALAGERRTFLVGEVDVFRSLSGPGIELATATDTIGLFRLHDGAETGRLLDRLCAATGSQRGGPPPEVASSRERRHDGSLSTRIARRLGAVPGSAPRAWFADPTGRALIVPGATRVRCGGASPEEFTLRIPRFGLPSYALRLFAAVAVIVAVGGVVYSAVAPPPYAALEPLVTDARSLRLACVALFVLAVLAGGYLAPFVSRHCRIKVGPDGVGQGQRRIRCRDVLAVGVERVDYSDTLVGPPRRHLLLWTRDGAEHRLYGSDGARGVPRSGELRYAADQLARAVLARVG